MSNVIFLSVCKDMELRFSNDSNNGVRNVEVCADDRWCVAVVSAVRADDSHKEQNISLQAKWVGSTSVTLTWSADSLQSSVLSTSVMCTAAFHQASHEVKMIASNTTTVQVTGLIPDTTYECCVNVHGVKSLMNCMIISGCIRTKTLSAYLCNPSGMIGLSIFSICLLCVCVGLIAILTKQHIITVKGPKE